MDGKVTPRDRYLSHRRQWLTQMIRKAAAGKDRSGIDYAARLAELDEQKRSHEKGSRKWLTTRPTR
jgi:hypothetical protein